MKKLFIFTFLIFVFAFAGKASASNIVNKITSKPITLQELKTLDYLVFTQHSHFTTKNLRGLLRNYVGSNAEINTASAGGFNQIGSTIKTANKINKKYCSKYQYLLVSGKVVKEKINEICPERATMRKRGFSAWYNAYSYNYVNKPKHGKKLAMFVYKVLKAYPSIYNNINAQGRHYQTALYIASARSEAHVVYLLLTDKYINPAITTISDGHVSLYGTYDYQMLPYMDNKEVFEQSMCSKRQVINYFTNSTNQVYPAQVFLRNIANPTPFDLAIKHKLRKETSLVGEIKDNEFIQFSGTTVKIWPLCHKKGALQRAVDSFNKFLSKI